MNRRIYVGGIAAVLIAVLAVFTLSTPTIIQLDDKGKTIGTIQTGVTPLEPTIHHIKIKEITDRAVYIEIKIDIANNNQRSIILQLVSYNLYDSDTLIHRGQIGKRAEGMVIGSNFYTILSNSAITLTDTIILKNIEINPEFREKLQSNDLDWRLTGTLVYNLSSITSGGENDVEFDLTLS